MEGGVRNWPSATPTEGHTFGVRRYEDGEALRCLVFFLRQGPVVAGLNKA